MTCANLPDVLPEKPTGWTKRMSLHLNLGPKGGVGIYRVFDDRGVEMPVTYAYGPKGTAAGFQIKTDAEDAPRRSWADLRVAWPAFVAQLRAEGAE